MAMGRSNSSIEVQVSLGLQEANQQIAMLHKQLEESVKVDSKGFGNITKLLDNATNQAEKLGVKMSDAFKTSAGSKSFLRDYQKMLDTLSQIRSKMGNLGFEDIKFSVDDQNTINNTVKQMEELQKALDGISRGKAIEVIDRSAVDNVDLLKQTIKDLSIDTSKLTFDNLRTRLSDAADEASKKLEETRQKITDIDRVTKNLDAAGLVDIQSKLNTSQGLNIKLIDDKSIDTANERLRELKAGLDDISDKTKSKLQVTQKTNDIGDFIRKQTDEIKSEYTEQLNTIGECKEKIQQALASLKAGGHPGANGRTYFTNEELTAVLNTDAMKASLAVIGLDIEEAFAGMQVGQKVSRLREELTSEINKIDAREVELTGLRDGIQEKIAAVFDGLTTSTVTNVGKLQKSISGILDGVEINVGDLKKFGFDVNSIQAGESLAAVYDRLKTAIEGYRDALSSESVNLSNTELVERQQACDNLAKSIEAANKAETESGNVADSIKGQIAALKEQIADLVKKYNELTGQKVEINLGNTVQKTNDATSAIRKYIDSITKLETKQKMLSNVSAAVTRWMGFYQVLNLTKRAISSMAQHIKELDTVMTRIAVVTNMTTNDLWNQIGTYSEIARQYGVAIKGVYEVSQIYYQQGLNKGDVMGLTTETLKMARIAGLDYATAADYMTTAIRGFKLEMSDAAHVTDVFSALAASTASSTEELAVAISKTAASAASVGASFEATSAMMATMIATTRESATNIGTALKSIIARYGELKQNMTGTDAEGEEYSLNKVDTALQSVGISIHNAKGEFKDFDEVILELGEKWDTIDKNAQRYIATVMAGNRQQSRFLALVSNVEEYKRALEIANNAEGSGELQTLKTLDSIDAKIERMKVTIQEFYTSSGLQDLYKGVLDTITNIISAANDLPKAFGKIPVAALAIGINLVRVVKNVLLLILTSVKAQLKAFQGETNSAFEGLITSLASKFTTLAQRIKQVLKTNIKDGIVEASDSGVKEATARVQGQAKGGAGSGLLAKASSIGLTYLGAGLSTIGAYQTLAATSAYGSSTSRTQDVNAGRQMMTGGILGIAGDAATGAAMGTAILPGWGTAIGAVLGGIKGLVANFATLSSASQMLQENLARQLELDKKKTETTKTDAAVKSGETKDLMTAYTKLSGLKDAMYDSAEAMAEYHEYMNQLADSYPNLVSEMQANGNKIIELTTLEGELAKSRLETARATVLAAEAELTETDTAKDLYEAFGDSLNTIYTERLGEEFDPTNAIKSLNSVFGIRTAFGTNETQYNTITNPYEALVRLYDSFQQEENRLGKYKVRKHRGKQSWTTQTTDDEWEELFNANGAAIMATLTNKTNPGNGSGSKYLNSARESFKKSLEALGSDFNLNEITGNKDVASADDVMNLSEAEFIEAVSNAKRWAADNFKRSEQAITDLADAAFNTKVEQQVLEDADLDDKHKMLSNHTALFSSLSKQLLHFDEEVTSDYNRSQIDWLEDWLINANEDIINAVESLDFNVVANNNVETIKALTGVEDEKLLNVLSEKYMDMTSQARQDFITAITESVFKDSNGAVDTGNIDFFTALTSGESGSIAPRLMSKLQSQLGEYKKLRDNGYTIAANSYLVGLKDLYTQVGAITDVELASNITDILLTTDLQDSDSLKNAIDAIGKLENVPKEVSDALDVLYNHITMTITTQAVQLLDQAADLATSVKKTFQNLGKGMDFDDAFKAASEIYNKLTAEQKETINLQDLYKFDESLGKWIVTEDAIQLELNSLTEDYNTQVADLQASAALQSELLQELIHAQGVGVSDTQVLDTFLNKHAITGDEAAAYKILVEQWQKGIESGQSYDAMYQEILTSISEATERDLAAAESILKNSAIAFLASFDWASIAGGSANESSVKAQLSTLLTAAGINPEDIPDRVATLYTAALDGNIQAMNEALEGTGYSINNVDAKNIIKSNIDQYKSAIEDVTNKEATAWSDETNQLIGQLNLNDKDTNTILQTLYDGLKNLIGQGDYTLAQYNSDIAALTTKIQGIGKEKATIDLLKDGFKLEDFATYLNTYFEDYSIDSFFENGEATGAFAGLLELDENGVIQIVKGKELEVINAFNTALGLSIGTTGDMWLGFIGDNIDKQIADNEKNNRGKQITDQIKNLQAANTNDQIRVDKLRTNLDLSQYESQFAALGVDINSDIWDINSEYQRDAILLLLETAINNFGDEGKEILQETYNSIKEDIVSKKNKYQGISNLVGRNVDKTAAKNMLVALGRKDTSDEAVQRYMTRLGYKWNDWTQQFEATNKTADRLRIEINRLEQENANGSHTKELNTLRAQLTQLEYDIVNGDKQNELLAAVQNYTNYSYEAFANLQNAFTGLDLTKFVTDNGEGGYTVDIDGLVQFLRDSGVVISDTVNEALLGIVDNSMSSIQNAINMAMSGTTSLSDMNSFIDEYNKLLPTDTITTDVFKYNEILDAWTLDLAILRKYIKAQADALVEKGLLNQEDIDKWIESQTSKVLAESVNISDYLSAADKDKSSDAYKALVESMTQYYEYYCDSQRDIEDYISQDIRMLNAGGQGAVEIVKLWASRQGREATSDEIEAAFNGAINDLNDALDSLADITIGQLTTGKLREHLTKLEKVNADGVVTSVDNMVEVYRSIYNQMKVTAGHTTAGLNAAYAKVLTAGEQKDIDTLDALENAAGMTYDALGELLSTYGQDLETFMNGGAANGIEKAGFGKVRVIDWDTFAKSVFGEDYDSISNTPEYAEAYSAWVDSRAEFENREKERIESAIEQIEAIGEASSGDAINVSDLDAVLQGGLQTALDGYTVSLDQGLLKIYDASEIPSIMTSIMEVAQKSKAMLPEQLAALADTINQMLSDITELISNGIGKGLNNQERTKLVEWASGQGLELNFNETVDGFKLTNDSAKALYNTMNSINSLQGQVIFEELKDNLIETDEHFKSASANAAHMADLQRELDFQNQLAEAQNVKQNGGTIAAFEGLVGNVNMYKRPWINNADGSHSSLLSMGYEGLELGEMTASVLVTPIPEWAQSESDILSELQIDEYLDQLLAQNPVDIQALLELDSKGIEIDGKHISNMLIDIKDAATTSREAMDAEAISLHEWSDAWERVRQFDEHPDNEERIAALQEELALAQKIAEVRGLQEDASFKFMEQAIPSGQNNPLNYWENWQKAYKAMDEAASGSSKGTMAYQDFYNLVTEMGHLAEITDQSVSVGGQVLSNAQEAASLIEQAAGALEVQSDGSLKINLSKIGVDFASGADQMADDVDAGIHKVAESQIQMLDSLIGLLEVIVAMENMSDLDVDADLTLDLSEIFNIENDDDIKKITDYSEEWKQALQKWRDMMTEGTDTFNEDFKRGMESIKFTINGEVRSLAEIINTDFADLEKIGISPQFYQAIMNGLYESVRSGDFSETNIKELIMQNLQKHLGEMGGEIVFDMGNYTFIGSGNATFDIDWTADNTKEALEQFKGSEEQKRAQLIAAFQARGTHTATPFQYQTTLISDGKITIKDGKATITIEGKKYSYDANHPEQASKYFAAAELDKLGAKDITWESDKPVQAEGKVTMGQKSITVSVGEDGTIKYTNDAGLEADSPRELIDKEIEKQLTDEGVDAESERGKKIRYDAYVEAGISTVDLSASSYEKLNSDIRDKLEAALASGDRTEIDAIIDGNIELASLKGLSASEIEEKLGIKAVKFKVEGDTEETTAKLDELGKSVDNLMAKSPAKIETDADENNETLQKVKNLESELKTLDDMHPIVDVEINDLATNVINSIRENIASLQGKTITVTTNYVTNGSPHLGGSGHAVEATGNVGPAKSQGTLMGELGPELVVSNGRYFVVGQSGAEFVNLADDAIVFNHLQTEQLLKKGMSSTRGRAVTNEQNAVSFAHGNVTGGDAMASASAVLAQLKQLRAMWESLLGASAKDLVGKAGSGGGGGGSGNQVDPAFIKQLERWYNLLQDIATLEEKINYQENLRKKISGSYIGRNGKDYYNSQKKSLELLEEEIQKHQQLVKEQKKYFEQRQAELNSQSAFSSLYTFDENGQIKYKEGKFEELTQMFSSNPKTNKPNHTVEEQYNYLINQGYGYAMQYDSQGNKIDTSTAEGKQQAIQAFWDKIEADQNEMQGLHDSITEHENAILEAQEQQNEILKEIEDNQIALENQVLDAIVDMAQREIDAMQDQKDALEKSNQEFLAGLNDALQKERDMYSAQQNEADLMNKRRRLSLLQRTGASASEISSLQAEIDDATRDLYFEKQQEQIDAIQAASDAQLEKLQQQIDLAQESLEYQKEHGLLWEQVYEQMAKSPEEIANFIEQNDSKHWAESPTQFAQSNRDILFQAEQWRAFAEDTSNKTVEDLLKSIQKEVKKKLKQEGSGGSSSGGGGGGSGGGGSSGGDSGGGGSSGGGSNGNGNTNTQTPPPATTWTQHAKLTYINTDYGQKQVTGTGTSKNSKSEAQANALADAKSKAVGFRDTVTVSYYEAGGLNDYTGLAMLHGTPKKPEAILNAAQTSILRNEILGHSNDSLLSLLQDFRATYGNIANNSDYNSVDSSSSVVIEHAEVNMKVEKLANSYDAARAGDDVMRELLAIARKTSAQNRVGR